MREKILLFLDRKGNYRYVGLFTQNKILPAIVNYVKTINSSYVIPYIRSWKTEEGNIMYDVGSHSEFFVVKEQEEV